MSSSNRGLLLGVLAAALLAACAPAVQQPSEAPPVPQISDTELRDRAKQNPPQGIGQYRARKYQDATRSLRGALGYSHISRPEQGTAHKSLAFIFCISGREVDCRDAFRNSLEVDP